MELLQHIYQIPIPLSGVSSDKHDPTVVNVIKESRNLSTVNKEDEPLSFLYINAYLIEGTEGNMLIDPGWNTADAYGVITSELKHYGFNLKDITHIVITHIHPDHCGLAGKIRQFSGAEIYINEMEASMLSSRYMEVDELIKDTLDMLLANGVPDKEAVTLSKASLPARQLVVPIPEYNAIGNGDIISFDPFEFKVISTPGHSPGHISLYEPRKKFLFTGDFILPEITPNISLHPQSGENPLKDYLESLEEVYDMEINFAFPGHGPAFSGVKPIIEVIQRHHKERSTAIIRALQGNTKTAYQLTQEIPWGIDINEGYNFLNILNRRFAITETMAHLEYLFNKGEIGKTIENNQTVYFA
jgi:glyoxylase-like metal-dependent hydrolase (beta-lactamase superfamily II)